MQTLFITHHEFHRQNPVIESPVANSRRHTLLRNNVMRMHVKCLKMSGAQRVPNMLISISMCNSI